MKKTENECVNCGLPCIGTSCRYKNVTRYYCDECKSEDVLYNFEDMELCKDCIDEILEERKVEGSY